MKRSAPLLRRAPLAPRRKRARTFKAERVVDPAHMARVATLPCLVCGAWPVEVHHIKDQQTAGGRRAGDDETLPLCPTCHRTGSEAFHALGSREWERRFGRQRDHLVMVVKALQSAGFDPT